MSAPVTHGRATTVSLSLPDLVDQPFLGSGCCVVAADDALRQELEGWPGVISANISADTGQAVILATSELNLEPILETLESLGFPAQMKPATTSEGR
jgi:hypothetical protein